MPPARAAERLPFAGRGDQRPESGKAVGRDQTQPRQFTQCLLHLGGKKAGQRHQFVEERGPALLQDISYHRGVARQLAVSAVLLGEPLAGVLPEKQCDRRGPDRSP